MPLRWQKIEIPFERGMDTGTHAFAIKPPLLDLVQNGRFTKNGSIAKRNGYTNMPVFGGEWAVRPISYKDSLLCAISRGSAGGSTAPGNVESALVALNNSEARWDDQGLGDSPRAISEATVRRKITMSRDGVDAEINPDVGYHSSSDQKVIAWQLGEGAISGKTDAIYAIVIDNTTGAEVVSTRLVSTHQFAKAATLPRVVVSTTEVYVVYAIQGDTELRAAVYDTGTRSWTSDDQLVTDYNASGGVDIFDACALEGGSGEWYIAYRKDDGGGSHDVEIKRYTADSTTASHSATINRDPDSTAIGISAYASEEVWVAYGSTDATRGLYAVARSEADLTSVLAETAIETDAAFAAYNVATQRISANKAVILWTDESGTAGGLANDKATELNFTTLDTGGTVDPSSPQVRYGAALLSKPAIENDILYVNVLYDGVIPHSSGALERSSEGFACVLTLAVKDVAGLGDAESLQEWRPVARTLTAAVGAPRSKSTLTNFVSTDTTLGTYDFAATETFRSDPGFSSDPDQEHDGVNLMRINLASGHDRWMWTTVGDMLWLSGGVTMVFDGSQVSEHGFHFPPENLQISLSVGTGQLSAGDYQVIGVFEFQGNDGTRWQSAPILARDSSGNTSITAAANDAIKVEVHPMSFSQKMNANISSLAGSNDGQMAIRLYRTIADGTIFYLETIESSIRQVNPTSNSGTTLTLGDSGAAGHDDTEIQTHEQLYTTGGVLANYPMPPTDDIAFWKSRVWGIPSEDKTKVVFTKERVEGELPSWHPFFEVVTNSDDDNIAIAPMDDRLIVFKTDAIWAISGAPADDKGLASTLRAHQIASDQGCIDKRSVVLTPLGLFFQSRLGIFLLDRGLNVKFIGERVETYTTTGTIVYSAVALSDLNAVYFNVDIGGAGLPATLVYDYSIDEWMVDSVGDGDNGSATLKGAVYHKGDYFVVKSPTLAKHTGFDDFTEFIPTFIRTGWIGVDGMQGFQRLRFVSVLGERKDKHKLTINVDTDYIGLNGPANDYTDAQLQTMVSGRWYQPKVHVDNQRCGSFRVRIQDDEDDTNTGTSEGVVYLGIAADVGIKGGIRRQINEAMR